jgi:hypothetical protein
LYEEPLVSILALRLPAPTRPRNPACAPTLLSSDERSVENALQTCLGRAPGSHGRPGLDGCLPFVVQYYLRFSLRAWYRRHHGAKGARNVGDSRPVQSPLEGGLGYGGSYLQLQSVSGSNNNNNININKVSVLCRSSDQATVFVYGSHCVVSPLLVVTYTIHTQTLRRVRWLLGTRHVLFGRDGPEHDHEILR